MAGNKEGGLKTATINKQKYGEDYYKRIGALGGKISRGGGFASDSEMARLAGRLGGLKSARGDADYTPDENAIKNAKLSINEYKTYRKYNGSNS